MGKTGGIQLFSLFLQVWPWPNVYLTRSVSGRLPTNTKTEKATEVSPLISQSAAWWSGVQEQFKQALGTALEKSAANYDAIKSVSETVAKNSASQFKAAAKPKAPAKASSKAPAKVATRAAKTAKAATKTPAKAARKAPVGSAAKAKTVAAPVRRAAK